MRNKVLLVILIVSLSLNAVFITWFAANLVVKHVFNRKQTVTEQTIAPASMPGRVGPLARIQAKAAVSKYIKTCIPENHVFAPHNWEFERACVSPYNELGTVRAASAIINARNQIRFEEAEINDAQHAMFGINTFVNRERVASSESTIKQCNEAIQDNINIIRNRDPQSDGQFLGWQVKVQFSVKNKNGSTTQYYERFIVKSSSRSVILEQTLDSSSPSNFDSTVQVIREILKGETVPDVQP